MTSYLNENTSYHRSHNDYNSADKQAMQKCRSLEREVVALRAEVESSRGSEGPSKQAVERTFQELKKLRMDVNATEMERDRMHGEILHLDNIIEDLCMNLQKEMAERDHWKENIESIKNDLEILERKRMQDMATIENTRFAQMQVKNMAEQYVINNNTIEIENQNSEVENERRLTEKEAAKQNIIFFESERNSLKKHIETQEEEVKALRHRVEKVGKENDELNEELDIAKDERALYEILPQNIKHARMSVLMSMNTPFQKVRRSISSRTFNGLGERIKVRSSVTVNSAPIRNLSKVGRTISRRNSANLTLGSIDETDNSL